MSNWREQIAEEEETRAIMDWLTDYYHYPILLFLVGFAFWNRIRNYSNFIIDGRIFYSGNDPWYHARSTEYVVHNFPQTMPYDPWTGFPVGRFVGQFGTIFDQVIALAALTVGLGSPSAETTRMVILLAPAVFGLLVCVPAYLIGHRLGDRFGGIIAVMFVALAPDRLLQMSLAGNPQHHSAEVLTMGFAILGVMIALTAAEREKPVFELLQAREFEALRGTIGWSMLAGVAIAVYLWVWPPGVWIFGILGAFFVIHLSIEHVRKRSPEHPAFVGVISIGTAALLQLGTVRTIGLAPTDRTLLQPGLGLVVALGIVFLAWLSRELESRDSSPYAYPGAVAGSITLVVGLTALILPDLFSFFVGQLDRVFGFVTGTEGGAATIGEAGRGASRNDFFDFYRFATFTAILGAILIVIREALDEDPEGQQLLVVVWAGFMTAATLTQLRFGYYMTLPIGALNAVLVGYIMQFMKTPEDRVLPESYQVMTVLVVVFIMFVPMMGMPVVGGGQTAMDLSDGASQPGDIMGWSDSLDWMEENTPAPGQYGNPDGEPMEYYGQFEKTDDFEYPPGAYGVLSWWDYGHWITAEGERIANANPFQQHASEAADFLMAQDEEEATEVLESNFDDHDDAQTRYVMIDAMMVETETFVQTQVGVLPTRGKFFAPADFHDEYERSDFYRHAFLENSKLGIVHKQAYYETMVNRLYHYHGSAQEPIPMLTEWIGGEQIMEDGPFAGEAIVNVAENQAEDPLVQFAENMSVAQERAADDPSNQIGGIGPYPEQRVEALDHFRLVYQDEVPAVQLTGGNDDAWEEAARRGMTSGPHWRTFEQTVGLLEMAENNPREDLGQHMNFLYPNTPSFTKTFERVEGATIEGEIEINETVPESVTLEVPIEPENGNTFTYTQEATVENGEFSATVPYSTIEYDEWGVDEGYTNVSARATGPYEIRSSSWDDGNASFEYHGTVNVTEGQVIGEETDPATVTLEQREVPDPFADLSQEELEEIFGDQIAETDDEQGDETDPDDGEAEDDADGTTEDEADDETDDETDETTDE